MPSFVCSLDALDPIKAESSNTGPRPTLGEVMAQLLGWARIVGVEGKRFRVPRMWILQPMLLNADRPTGALTHGIYPKRQCDGRFPHPTDDNTGDEKRIPARCRAVFRYRGNLDQLFRRS